MVLTEEERLKLKANDGGYRTISAFIVFDEDERHLLYLLFTMHPQVI
jgi:hypothetical protein